MTERGILRLLADIGMRVVPISTTVKTFACACCGAQISLKTMELDEQVRPVCQTCYATNASPEEIACVISRLESA